MREFRQVDVFGNERYAGNPVAVVLDGVGLSSEQMQRFANWTNLSETTFVLPAQQPGAFEEELVDRLAAGTGVDRATVVDAQWVDKGAVWVGGTTATCVTGQVEL